MKEKHDTLMKYIQYEIMLEVKTMFAEPLKKDIATKN